RCICRLLLAALATLALPALTLCSLALSLLSLLPLAKLGAICSAKPSAHAFNLQLLFVCSSLSCSAHLPLSGSFYCRSVHTSRHVVSRQSGAAGFRGEIRARIEQCFDRGRMLLLDGPHQCRRPAKRFSRIHVCACSNQRLNRLRISVSCRKHYQRFA